MQRPDLNLGLPDSKILAVKLITYANPLKNGRSEVIINKQYLALQTQ